MTVWRLVSIPIVAVVAVLSALCAAGAVIIIPVWRSTDEVTVFSVAWPVIMAAASFGFGVIALRIWRAPRAA